LFDISKRKQGEEALRQEKETAQRYLDVAAVMFLVLDASGKVTLINKRGCEILGYPEKEIVGRDWIARFIPEKIREDMRITRKRMISGEIESIEYFENAVLTKTGEERIIAWHNTQLRNEGGEITGCLSSGEDITERRRAEVALRDSLNRLRRTLDGTVTALAIAVETRDPYTAGHQRGVAQLACAIAAEMGFSPDRLEGMRVMGFLHDIGKIAVPAEILSKPGRLSEYEFNIVKFHSQVSYDILKEVDFPWPVALAVLQHHEKIDGSGYPHGLKGEDIIIEARILTVADVVEAMASHRPYRPALGTDQAVEEISKQRDILYDPEVVDACLKVLRENRVRL
jgi:PAS domain S-box-containing protein